MADPTAEDLNHWVEEMIADYFGLAALVRKG